MSLAQDTSLFPRVPRIFKVLAAILILMIVGGTMHFVGNATASRSGSVVAAKLKDDAQREYVKALEDIYRQAEHHRTTANQLQPDDVIPDPSVFAASQQGDEAAITKREDYARISMMVSNHREACDDNAAAYNQRVTLLAGTDSGRDALTVSELPIKYAADRCNLNSENPSVGSLPGNSLWYEEPK